MPLDGTRLLGDWIGGFARSSDDGRFMNRIDKFFGLKNEAKVRYLDGEFEVVSPFRLRI